jgi:hypothetical protein
MRVIYWVFFTGVAALEGCHALSNRPELPGDASPQAEVAREKLGKTLPPKDRAEVAAVLSKTQSLRLDTIAAYYPHARSDSARPITVENELAYVGACVSVDGNLVDRRGKEIHFAIRYGQGTPPPIPPKEVVEENRRLDEELRRKCTVIDVDLDPFNIVP